MFVCQDFFLLFLNISQEVVKTITFELKLFFSPKRVGEAKTKRIIEKSIFTPHPYRLQKFQFWAKLFKSL